MNLTFSEALLNPEAVLNPQGIDKKQEVSTVSTPAEVQKQGEIWVDLPDSPEQTMPADWRAKQLQHRITLLSQALQRMEADRRERVAVAVLSGLASSVEAHRREDGTLGARVLPADFAAKIACAWADALIERLDSPPLTQAASEAPQNA